MKDHITFSLYANGAEILETEDLAQAIQTAKAKADELQADIAVYENDESNGEQQFVMTVSPKPASGMSGYIIETPNQIWYVADCDGKPPLWLSNNHPMRERHVFDTLEQAKEVLPMFWNLRGGAKLKIWQLSDDGQRVEVAVMAWSTVNNCTKELQQ